MQEQNLNLKSEQMRMLTKEQLTDILLNSGTLQEANRTFFHPLNLHLKLNDWNTLELYEPIENEHVFYNTINKITHKIFNTFAQIRYRARQKILGFTIQYKDMYGSQRADMLSSVDLNKFANDKISELYNKQCVETYKQILIIYEKIKDFPLEEQKKKLKEYMSMTIADDMCSIRALIFLTKIYHGSANIAEQIEKYKKQYNKRTELNVAK